MAEPKSLAEVRQRIDALDDEIVDLLVRRSRMVVEAARHKPEQAQVVVPERIEEIIARVRKRASERGAPPDLFETIYRTMIDAFIAYERDAWRKLHPSG